MPSWNAKGERRGCFRLRLNSHGLIHGAGGPIDKDQLDAAVRVAMATFARDGASPAVLAEHERFISALHQTASQLVTELPKDLFAPVDPDRTARREVALPDGAQGEVTVRFTALADPATGLMDRRSAKSSPTCRATSDAPSRAGNWPPL